MGVPILDWGKALRHEIAPNFAASDGAECRRRKGETLSCRPPESAAPASAIKASPAMLAVSLLLPCRAWYSASMLDGDITFAMRQLDIFGRHVTLKIDKRLARTALGLWHLPEFAAGTSSVQSPVQPPTAS